MRRALSFLLVALVSGAGANVYAIKTIKNDATGGDCQIVGNWSDSSKTCRLTQDLSEGMVVADNGITLDGSGHTLVGPGRGNGVELHNRKGVTVENLVVRSFHIGIDVRGGGDHWLENNTLTRQQKVGAFVGNGIVVMQSEGNWVGLNKVVDNDGIGIFLSKADYNTIYLNTFKDNEDAVYLRRSSRNTLDENDLQGSSKRRAQGFYLWWGSNDNVVFDNKVKSYQRGSGLQILGNSSGNLVMFNEFESNQTWAIYLDGTSNSVLCNDLRQHGNLALSIAMGTAGNDVVMNNFYLLDDASDPNPGNVNRFLSNYWQVQNCPDANNDGICDVPHRFPANVDPGPLKAPVPWKQFREICSGSAIPPSKEHPGFEPPDGFGFERLGFPPAREHEPGP